MGKTAKGFVATNGHSSPSIDWPALKEEIVSKLDIVAEYRALGVEFTRPTPDAKERLECHAMGRKDEVPSAFVNARTGVYHDSGGEGESLGFFDFAMKHGSFGRWIDCMKHYAEKAGVEVGTVRTKSGGRIEEARYFYRDGAGEIRYAVFRYRLPNGKKTFTQHPADGRGGWKYGAGCMDGIEPLPYELPRLLDAFRSEDATGEIEPIFIVEGEKDADRLIAEGLLATTSHGGTGNTDKTWPKFAEIFRGRECVIFPDNDPGGRLHARKVAGYLHGVADSVKVVQLPGLPPKGDISNWLDSGGTADELGRLAYDTPKWDPADQDLAPADESNADNADATVATLRTYQSATSWVWPLWIPGSALTLVAAEPGVGKTRFCFDLARRLWHGLPWPDGAEAGDPHRKTLWVVADNQWQEMVDIAAAFGIPDEMIILNAPASDPYSGTSLQTAEEFADLEARILRVKPTLVMIDTITNTGDFKAQDSSDAKRQYKPLQEIATRAQTAILCVTHLNAGGKVLGRRAVEKVRVVMQMESPDPEGQPYRRKLWVSKTKALRPEPLGVTMGNEGNEYDNTPPVAPETGPTRHNGAVAGPPPRKTAECMKWLRDQLADGPVAVARIRDLAEEQEHTVGTLYTAKRRLNVQEQNNGRFKTWSLSGTDDGHPPRAAPANGVPF